VNSQDEQLRRAREGDLSAFNALVLEHQSLVFNLCFRQLGQRQTAEDATQETLISAWRNIRSLRGPFRPWLLRIAANACTDELRRRGRRPASSLDVALEAGVPEPPDEAPLPETSALQGELRREVEAALSKLPDEQRLAVVLCDLQGLDYAEIAGVTRTSLGTVKSRIARGRARLRELLASELFPSDWRLQV
jgi:RNA polymerase sigma-70 factor (ECF subfamily)